MSISLAWYLAQNKHSILVIIIIIIIIRQELSSFTDQTNKLSLRG